MLRKHLSQPGFIKPYLWLHCKKTAGTSLRRALGDNYWTPKPSSSYPSKIYIPSFMQLECIYWNSVLNRYRTPLGEYTFKKLLFAKKYLYSNFDEIESFTIVRDPHDRVISMFKYLSSDYPYNFANKASYPLVLYKKILKKVKPNGLFYSNTSNFTLFLEAIRYSRANPWDSPHFSSHTANVYDDITDYEGNILVKHIINLEDIETKLEGLLNSISQKYITLNMPKLNVTGVSNRNETNLFNTKNKQLFSELFGHDIELYENALKN